MNAIPAKMVFTPIMLDTILDVQFGVEGDITTCVAKYGMLRTR